MTTPTKEQAIAYIESVWGQLSGCSSCGWHGLPYEYGPLDQYIDDDDLKRGSVHFYCLSKDEDGSDHRGMDVYLPAAYPQPLTPSEKP